MEIKIDFKHKIVILLNKVTVKELKNFLDILTNNYGEDWRIGPESLNIDTPIYIPDHPIHIQPYYTSPTTTPYAPPYTVTSTEEKK